MLDKMQTKKEATYKDVLTAIKQEGIEITYDKLKEDNIRYAIYKHKSDPTKKSLVINLEYYPLKKRIEITKRNKVQELLEMEEIEIINEVIFLVNFSERTMDALSSNSSEKQLEQIQELIDVIPLVQAKYLTLYLKEKYENPS